MTPLQAQSEASSAVRSNAKTFLSLRGSGQHESIELDDDEDESCLEASPEDIVAVSDDDPCDVADEATRQRCDSASESTTVYNVHQSAPTPLKYTFKQEQISSALATVQPALKR